MKVIESCMKFEFDKRNIMIVRINNKILGKCQKRDVVFHGDYC